MLSVSNLYPVEFIFYYIYCILNNSIGKSLGQGTFGKVRLGTHTLTGEKVAIKILEKDKIIDSADVERVTREIHILKIVRHPNVI
jgi:5'-AMP-activated protein kinase catalytic alpha subunit